jgi:hypothetical protein
MKKQLLTLAFLFTCILLNAQSWQWAGSAGVSGGAESATAVATDGGGNVYVAGNFTGTSITFGGTTLTNGGSGSDMFITKYDPWGGVVWTKRIGGTNNDKVFGINIDPGANILITGIYASNVLSFGSVFLTNTTAGFSDLFVAKIDPSGTVLWAKKGGGNGDDISNAVCSDAAGNVFITGGFSSTTLSFGTTSVPKTGTKDVFTAKFDLNGTLLWVENSGGIGCSAEGTGVSADLNGNAIITGYFQGGSIGFGSNSITNAGSSDIFIAKYNDTGINFWARSAGGAGQDQASAICTDANGNAYITGSFYSASAAFGINTITNTNVLTDDIFVAKYDNQGYISWAVGQGGNGNDGGKSISCDASDHVYVAGYFSAFVLFGSTTLVSNGAEDIFITRYSGAGIAGYSKGAGGTGNDAAMGINIDPVNNAYLVGGFLSSTFPLGSTTLINADLGDSVSDMFITKLNHVNAVNDPGANDMVSVFPNPSTGQFEINLPVDATAIKILNAVGEITETRNVKGNADAVFNIKENGVYFIQIFSNQYVITKKLIVQN